MSDPSTTPAPAPLLIRLRAFYQTAGALLRELSRALSRGRTTIRAESGLPVGSRLGLVLQTAALRPIEVVGTVTGCKRRGESYEITLRYDLDLARFRDRVAEAVAALKGESPPHRPRLESRVPIALPADAARIGRALSVTVDNLSREGCRLELRGDRQPRIEPGARVELSLGARGSAKAARLLLEVRWVASVRTLTRGRSLALGGRFLELSATAQERIGAILDFEDYRPRIQIRRIRPRPRRAAGRR